MQTTAVPRALAALLQILQEDPGLTTATVIDGPPVQDLSASDLVVVGWTPVGDEPVAESSQDFAYAGARTRTEDFTLSGWAESWSGEQDFATRRARAYELLAVIETALRATAAQPEAPTLLGTVQWAHLTGHRLQQLLTDQGARVGIAWTVSCHARL
ncbi:hypothetical protein ACFCXC_18370 [Streptomyces microflavus]|uniref:hypothetical protein n=1 Tax=Streptomyces microflavus TaxID=1919 RepID=UPI003411B941